MRMLICGEEPEHIEGLRHALDDFGLDWELEHVPAADCLDDGLGQREFDALVTVLPKGDSERQAFDQLKASNPGAVRVLLLEPDQGADPLTMLERAHRVLERPVDPIEFIDALESVMELREIVEDPQLQKAVGRIKDLPGPPRLYLALTELMRDPDVEMASVAELIQQDPAVAARVLRLCNSAFFSAGREVTSIQQAATRLGLDTLRRVVLASEAFSHGKLNQAEREAMQARALRVSQVAAGLLGGASAELAATAGLLSEVGRLIPDAWESGSCPEEQEHAAAGAYLLGLWGLPDPIVEAVAFQYSPRLGRLGGFWVTGAVHVASALVNGTEVDSEYLAAVGKLDKLPQWVALLEETR